MRKWRLKLQVQNWSPIPLNMLRPALSSRPTAPRGSVCVMPARPPSVNPTGATPEGTRELPLRTAAVAPARTAISLTRLRRRSRAGVLAAFAPEPHVFAPSAPSAGFQPRREHCANLRLHPHCPPGQSPGRPLASPHAWRGPASTLRPPATSPAPEKADPRTAGGAGQRSRHVPSGP